MSVTEECQYDGAAQGMAVGVIAQMLSFTWIGDPSHCMRSTRSPIPNVLHKVWVGPPPLPAEDLVSLLTAALLLAPEAIHYWVTHPATQAALSCHSHLGVRFHLVNLTDPEDAFNQATANFKVCTPWERLVGLSQPVCLSPGYNRL